MMHPFRTKQTGAARGSALIGLVVAILIFAVLATAIVPLIGSSSQQEAIATMSTRAYLMAESGFRYAASRYLHAGARDAEKNAVLEALDGAYPLNGGRDRFTLAAYSYFATLTAPSSGAPGQFKAHFPGAIPPDISITSGLRLNIEDQDYTIDGAVPVIGEEDDNMTITVSPPLAFYPSATRVYPTARAVSVQTVVNGSDTHHHIVVETNSTRMFPSRNGRIALGAGDQTFTYRFNDVASNRLMDIRDPDNPYAPLPSVPAASGTKIRLLPHVRLESTGVVGSEPMQVRRTVTFHAPLPLSFGIVSQTEIVDRFDDKQNWTDTAGTTTSAGGVDGNSALRVDAAASDGGADQGSLTLFTPTTIDAADLFNANLRLGRGYLSYDTQVKIGYESVPAVAFFPDTPVPAYVAAGLNFRVADPPASGATIFNVNTYGISFLRGNDGLADGIPDPLVPLQDQRAIVLWQQTANGGNRNWIAYKAIPVIVSLPLDDFEGISTWSKSPNDAGNLWTLSTRHAYSGSRAWGYNTETSPGVFTYDTGARTSGALQSPTVALPGDYPSIALTFWSRHVTEPFNPANDLKTIRISANGGPFVEIFRIDRDPDAAYWFQEQVDLSAYAGQTVQLQFFFDSVNGANNNYEGWTVDDVQIISQWPLEDATLGIRLQEALVVPFTNGQPEIRVGDRIYGNSRRTVGTVMVPPLVTSGNWETTPASGTLLLHRTSVLTTGAAFDAAGNEQLTVIGGLGRANVAAQYSESDDRKANIIQAYYASATGGGNKIGNRNPLDHNHAPYARAGALDDLVWFPSVDGDGNWTDEDGNFTASEDVFRLIQWDAINDGNVTALDSIAFTTKDQGLVERAIVQSHHDALQSPDFPGIVSQFELGLHAIGDGALNVYFDDFGLLIEGAEPDIVPTPLQE